MTKIERDLWNSIYNTSISRVKFVWTWVGPPYTIQSFPLYFLFALTLLYHTETQPPPFVRWAPKSRSRSKGGKFDCSLRESKRVNEPINLMSRWRMGAWFPRPPSLPPCPCILPPLSSPFSFQFALPAVQCARRRSGIRMIPLNMVNRDIAKSIKYQRDILLFYCLSYKNMM